MTASVPSNRAYYDRQLRALREDLLLLGSMVEKSVQQAVNGLRTRNVAAANRVISDDARIDQTSYKLEEDSLLLIATQQPIASDLRTIAAVLFIASELERMGDYAEGIAKIALRLSGEEPIKPLVDIPRMAEVAAEMLHQSLDAFVDHDLDACRRIWERDDEVDDLYNQVYRELLLIMLGDPRTIEQATLLLWAAHNIERIADRVTNICERAAFVVTGNPQALKTDDATRD